MVAAINNNAINHLGNLATPQDEAHYNYGVNLFNAGNYGPAWVAFNEAIKINPKEQLYFYMRGASSSHLGHYKAALTDYNMAMSLAKNNEERGWIHFDLAIVYNLMDDEQSALFHMTTAARLGNGMAQNICQEFGIPY